MRTTYYLNGKRISRRQILYLIGRERLKRILEDARDIYREDPLVQNDFCIDYGMLTVEFSWSTQMEVSHEPRR